MKIKLLFIMLLVLLLFSSCSYADFEDGIKHKITPEESTKINIEIKPDESIPLKSVGDTITINDSVAELSYKINNVAVYNSFSESGIEAEKLADPEAGKKSQAPFVLVDITVTNEKALINVDSYNIAVFHLMNKEIFSDPWSKTLPEISYFSASESNGSDYFHYKLPEGESAEFKIGWILRDPVTDGNDLILHVGANIQENNYIDLSSNVIGEN